MLPSATRKPAEKSCAVSPLRKRPSYPANSDTDGLTLKFSLFGLAGNAVLHRDPGIVAVADALCVKRAEHKAPVLRRYAETTNAAKSWKKKRRVAARIKASTLGLDIRFVVTNLTGRNAKYLYGTLYCARGQTKNLIKRHKAQLASDRTSYRSALANQVRLIFHTAAYC